MNLKMVLRQVIIAYLLTTTLFSLTVLIDSNTRSGCWFIFVFIINTISFGLPNVVFLLLMYWLKIGKDFLLKTKYLLIEITLLFMIHFIVNKAVTLIPIKYRLYSSPTSTGLKYAFEPQALIFYSFIFLFIVLFSIERITKRWKHKVE
jgi:hypothetical protein